MKGFNNAYNLLPANFQRGFKIKIMSICGWDTDQQWLRKKSGVVNLHKLEKEMIKQEFALYNINADTAEYINPTEMPESYLKEVERRA